MFFGFTTISYSDENISKGYIIELSYYAVLRDDVENKLVHNADWYLNEVRQLLENNNSQFDEINEILFSEWGDVALLKVAREAEAFMNVPNQCSDLLSTSIFNSEVFLSALKKSEKLRKVVFKP